MPKVRYTKARLRAHMHVLRRLLQTIVLVDGVLVMASVQQPRLPES